jgi:hypothetical protein
MPYLAALLIFLAIAAATWFVGVAIYHSLFPVPDVRGNPNFTTASCVSILLVTLTSFAPFPWGYLFALGVWALAVWGILELPRLGGSVLFAVLAALSYLSRLAILGVLSL